jgi:hypothetical protein
MSSNRSFSFRAPMGIGWAACADIEQVQGQIVDAGRDGCISLFTQRRDSREVQVYLNRCAASRIIAGVNSKFIWVAFRDDSARPMLSLAGAHHAGRVTTKPLRPSAKVEQIASPP